MSAVALADAKSHLRVDFSSDDDLIAGLIEAAEDYVETVGVEISTPTIQPAVRHAVLLMVSHFYNNREAVTAEAVRALPFGVDALLQPYREQEL